MSELTVEAIEGSIKDSKVPVVLYFTAEWCNPCRMLKPHMLEASSDREDLKMVMIDIDENNELVNNYSIMSVPTVIGFSGGEEKDRFVGARNLHGVNTFINGLVE